MLLAELLRGRGGDLRAAARGLPDFAVRARLLHELAPPPRQVRCADLHPIL